jgi:hypothetical protein
MLALDTERFKGDESGEIYQILIALVPPFLEKRRQNRRGGKTEEKSTSQGEKVPKSDGQS